MIEAREWGPPKLQTSVVPGDNCPAPYYERHGLLRTGKMLDKEIELLGAVPA